METRIPFFIGSLILPFISVIRRSKKPTPFSPVLSSERSRVFQSVVLNWQIVLPACCLVLMAKAPSI
jgi:hypothetical protein